MKEIAGNLWDWYADGKVVCITTNGFIKKNGEGVMGAGCAKEAAITWPLLPSRLGSSITKHGNHVAMLEVEPFFYGKSFVVAFPVKHHWQQPADIELIKRSCRELVKMADDNGGKQVVIPRPGCGNGQLKWEDVKLEIQDILDDRFAIVSL